MDEESGVSSSVLSPVFQDHAQDLANRLHATSAPGAAELEREALEIVQRLAALAGVATARQARTSTIRRLFELAERAKAVLK